MQGKRQTCLRLGQWVGRRLSQQPALAGMHVCCRQGASLGRQTESRAAPPPLTGCVLLLKSLLLSCGGAATGDLCSQQEAGKHAGEGERGQGPAFLAAPSGRGRRLSATQRAAGEPSPPPHLATACRPCCWPQLNAEVRPRHLVWSAEHGRGCPRLAQQLPRLHTGSCPTQKPCPPPAPSASSLPPPMPRVFFRRCMRPPPPGEEARPASAPPSCSALVGRPSVVAMLHCQMDSSTEAMKLVGKRGTACVGEHS
jgi:hypothetical protein